MENTRMSGLKKLEIVEFVENTKKDIEDKIVNTIIDKDVIKILSGGKRLRSLLLILSFKVSHNGNTKVDGYQKALELAVSIELAHTASLVHDDIIDNDLLRRGNPALHVGQGVPNTILIGHNMIINGLKLVLNHRSEILKIYVDTWYECCSGQLDEINFNSKKTFDGIDEILNKKNFFKKYNEIIDKKTSSLFSASSKTGAMEAGAKGHVLQILNEYGKEVGVAYQLADDLIDLEKGEMINSVILPLLVKLKIPSDKINSFGKNSLKNKFVKNYKKIEEIYLQEINKHVARAEELSKSASIPNSPYKGLLTEFPRFIVNSILKI